MGKLAAIAVCTVLLFSSCMTVNSGADDELPLLPAKYHTGDAVASAAALLSANPSEATVLTDVKAIGKTVFLTFNGMADAETTGRLLDLLDIYKVKATFFLPGIKSAEDPDTSAEIARRGHQIGNYTLRAETHMDVLSAEALAEDFARTNAILSEITGDVPDILKCRATDYTRTVLRAAGAAGMGYVLDTTHNLSYQSFRSQEAAREYISGLERGAVLSVYVDGVLNEYEYAVSESPQPLPAGVSGTAAVSAKHDAQAASPEDRLVSVVEYLLEALTQERFTILPASGIPEHEDTDFTMDFNGMRAENDGAQAEIFTNARTTMRSVALSFRFLEDGERLDKLLAALEKESIAATFYVTGREIEDYPERIDKLLRAGHDLENGGMSGSDISTADFAQISFEIYKCGTLLEDRYGISSSLFMPPPASNSHNATVMEAASAQGYTLALYNKNPVKTDETNTQTLREYFNGGFHRGDIVYGNLDRFDGWDQFIPVVAEMVRDTGYGFATARELFEGQYPKYELTDIPGWKAVYANINFDPEIPRNEDFIERINTQDKIVFLSYDDWGSDKTVTGLLDTLSRHNVKVSFFVRTNGVENNPNLAKAIAEQGHDVLSHSHAHEVIPTLTIGQLQADSVKAHRILTETLGKAPALVYRPPTLEHDDRTLNTLFASGYRYIVGGDISTHDFERPAREVANMVLEEVHPGGIVLMHMSDNASANEATNIIIPALKAQGYTFARLSDYLKG